MFGEILGVYILNYWLKNIQSEFNLIELGPGKGTLLEDILRTTKLKNKFNKSANIKLIERNKKLIKIQKNNTITCELKNIEWLKKFNTNSNLPSIIYSNEFFDCLPVRQFYKNEIWYEKLIDYNKLKNVFYFKDKKVTTKKTLDYLQKYNETGIAEISFQRESLFNNLCKHIFKNKGMIILIDYGYKSPVKNFTLQSVSGHKKTHIFDNIGLQDITSLVNFGELINIANQLNLNVVSYCNQRDFLITNGIQERKEILKKNLPKTKREIIEQQYYRLTDKNSMGKDFKFFIVSS
jgi:SAM-dependent MidA family methyltransferase